MSDYTPTTDEVRGGFVTAPMAHEPRECAEAEFDRWLAAHDREVQERAWDAAVASLSYSDGSRVEIVSNGNPYRKAER